MKTIEYNKDGWVCDRYPYDLIDPVGELEVTDEEYGATFVSPQYFAWRVVNGKLVNERYEETPQSEVIEERIRELKRLLADSDYKAIKFSEGELTEEEYAPTRQQRRTWREEINELEQQNS